MDIRECDEKYTIKELKAICARHGLETTGNKRSLCLRLIRAGVLEGKILRWSGAGHPSEKLLKSGGSAEKIKEMAQEGKLWSEISDWITRQIGYDRDVLDWAQGIFTEARKVMIPGTIYLFTEPISDRDKDLAEIAVRLQSTEQWDGIAERLGLPYPKATRPPTKWEKEIMFYLMLGYKLKPGLSFREASGPE